MRKNCAYCGKSLIELDKDGNRTTRVDAKFDSDACRDKYWAKMRQIKRAYNRANYAIDLLHLISRRNDEIALVAQMHLNQMLIYAQQTIESD